MSSITISLGAFALALGGALFAALCGTRLPKHQVEENKEVVRLAMALVGTITGITLGLLIGSAKTYYDTQSNELTQMSASAALLGSLLDHYGPEAREAHESLRLTVERVLAESWPTEGAMNRKPSRKSIHIDEIYEQVRALAPKDEEHHMMKSEAIGLLRNVAQLHQLLVAQSASTVLKPMLFIMILWITTIFVSWGLFSRANPLSVITFVVTALCVSGAIFLILELYAPYEGVLRLSSGPLRVAYDSLSR